MWILLCYNGLVFPRNSVADTHVSDTYCSGVEAVTSHEGQRQERKSAKKAKSSVTREGKGRIIKNSSDNTSSGGMSSSTKSYPDESSEGVQRATWTTIEEFEAQTIGQERACGVPEQEALDKHWTKSNTSRMLHNYDLYKHVMGLSGSGVSAGIPTFDYEG
ncbi:hypothetical protein C6341_g13417 [Phytophthora cactorum]|nr:hypothetical protein C6341_g13417 [Phytophthora cactorum]